MPDAIERPTLRELARLVIETRAAQAAYFRLGWDSEPHQRQDALMRSKELEKRLDRAAAAVFAVDWQAPLPFE